MYEQITRYIDCLKPAQKRSVIQSGKQYFFLDYGETVRSYTRDIRSLTDSDSTDYREYLTDHSMEVPDNLAYINVGALSANTILYLLNYIEKGERRSAGFRNSFIRNGFINDALKRLKELG